MAWVWVLTVSPAVSPRARRAAPNSRSMSVTSLTSASTTTQHINSWNLSYTQAYNEPIHQIYSYPTLQATRSRPEVDKSAVYASSTHLPRCFCFSCSHCAAPNTLFSLPLPRPRALTNRSTLAAAVSPAYITAPSGYKQQHLIFCSQLCPHVLATIFVLKYLI